MTYHSVIIFACRQVRAVVFALLPRMQSYFENVRSVFVMFAKSVAIVFAGVGCAIEIVRIISSLAAKKRINFNVSASSPASPS